MKTGFMFVSLALAFTMAPSAQADVMDRVIKADAVANYQLQTQPAQTVSEIKLATVIAHYEQTPGALLGITNPFENAEVDYLVVDGQSVTAGDKIARITGASVEHFFHRLSVVNEQFAIAERQYANKKKLYQANALSADDWQQFLSTYIKLSDIMHELKTQSALFSQIAEDVAILEVPKSGRWLGSSDSMLVGQVIPYTRMAFVAEVPAAIAGDVQYLEIEGIRKKVVRYGESSRNGLVKVWATANESSWFVGEAYAATPIIAAEQAYRVPVAAVTSIDDRPIVFVSDGALIKPVEVKVQSLIKDVYYVTAESAITGNVVAASVPALQALLAEQGSEE